MTRWEQIVAAFPLHAQRIAELAGPSGVAYMRDVEPLDDAGCALLGAFIFEDTSEGSAYWWALCDGMGA